MCRSHFSRCSCVVINNNQHLALIRAKIAMCFIKTKPLPIKAYEIGFIVYINDEFIKSGKRVLSTLYAMFANYFRKQKINVTYKVLCSTMLRCYVGYKCI